MVGESVEEEVATRVDRRPEVAETDERPGAGGRTPHSGPGERGGGELALGGKIGRYTLLRRLGAGGMGEVFLGYDGELDRRVAIKVLRAEIAGDEATARLLREAQALARLSHPNVVQVFEVGQASGRIFVAMEYVAGVDLRSWLRREGLVGRPASRAQIEGIVGLMIQAGRGLAAAHAAGLAHRDVKPDNIFVGDDGRVRVGDFGLARSGEGSGVASADEASEEGHRSSTSALDAPLTRVGAAPGTPAYMAPEQRLGEFDGRSDLFAFTVTLWEAVMGERPFVGRGRELARRIATGERRPLPDTQRAPSWLVRALIRGLEPDPKRRWPSMDALLAELEAAPGRRRRLVGVGLVGALAVGAVLGVGLDRQRSEAACAALGEEAEETWETRQRPGLREAMVASGLPYAGATFERTAVWLDRYAAELAGARVAACRGERLERRHDEATRAEIDACLDDRQARLDALVTSLSAGGEEAVRRAISAAANLPAVDVCQDPVWRSRWVAAAGSHGSEELRRRLVLASADYSAGRYASGGAIVEAVIHDAEAEVAGDPAILASALVLGGKIRYREGDEDGASERLERAFVVAGKIGLDRVAVEAAINLVKRRGEPERALPWCVVSEGLLPRGEARPGPLTLTRAWTCGERLQELGRHEEVKALVEAALASAAPEVGEVHPALAGALNTLAAAEASLRDYPAALATMDRVEAIELELVGERHPDLIAVFNTRGKVLAEAGRMEEAIEAFRRALAIQEEAFGADHIDTAMLQMNLGIMRRMSGDFDGARAALAEALARAERALPPDDAQRLLFLGNLAQIEVEAGAHEEAAQTFARALELAARLFPPENPRILRLEAKLGWAAMERGDAEAAEEHLRRALPAMETAVGATHHDTLFALSHLGTVLHERGRDAEAEPLLERAIAGMESGRLAADQARVKATLAELLWSRPAERERALALAREARATLEAAGPDFATQAAKIDAWLAGRSG